MEDVRVSDWPEPPGASAWLPAYGFQHEILDKDEYFGSNGDNGSNHALYLETIVEETSDDLRSERSSAATWLSDSDADSVIQVRGNAGSECDSESEREWACPAKRRRRERASSPGSAGSLSRSSSLAQFESLERSCAAPASPSLSPDSLESPVASPPPTHLPPAPRPHLSAENLSEDSGYSERARRPPPRRQPEIAAGAAGSAPNLACPGAERRPARAARALSLPAELDVCAEPRRHVAHRSRFRQTFEVTESLTVSVADLTALDYRGGPRRPRLPPPPPPRQHPPPPPVYVARDPSPPIREPSAASDDTTESEIAFAREMEATARRLDEAAKRALEDTGNYDRELSVLTAQRLRDSWGAWDDVLDELRRRMEPSPPRSPSPRAPAYASTPLRSGDGRVRSTPELRAREAPRETPEELRASLQLVAPAAAAPPARSVSAGSRGVTFSPVVAEVSWREASASTGSASDDAADAEVVVVGGEAPRAPRSDRCAAMADAGARAPRSRIAGFLSRFANFRFSGRKEKKVRAGANGRGASSPVRADAGQGPRAAAGPHYVRIPLKEEVSRPAGPAAGGVAHKPPRARPPPAPGVLETDVDTQRTVLHARSLLALAPPDQRTPRPHKSMEFLLDKDSAQTIQIEEDCYKSKSGKLHLKKTANLTLTRICNEGEMVTDQNKIIQNPPDSSKDLPSTSTQFMDPGSVPRSQCDTSTQTEIKFLNKAVMVKPSVRSVKYQANITEKVMLSQPSSATASRSSTPSASLYEPSSPSTPSTARNTITEGRDMSGRTHILNMIKKHPKMYLGIPKPYYWFIAFLAKQCNLRLLHVMIALFKIKQNDTIQRISHHFQLSQVTLQKLLRVSIPQLATYLQMHVYLPDPLTIKKTLPPVFKVRYANVQCIIDCFEIQIEKASNPVMQSRTWSQYKSCNTLKYLIACCPNGFICFISKGIGGRVSDKAITELSGFVDILPPGAVVLADRGFKGIETLLSQRHVKLLRPPSVSSNEMPTKMDVIQTKVIASLRIHVERVIRRLREFAFLKPHSVINHQHVKYVDEAVLIACALVNLQGNIIKMQ